MLGSIERGKVRLISREMAYFAKIPTSMITIPQRHIDGQTDNLAWQYRALRSIAR